MSLINLLQESCSDPNKGFLFGENSSISLNDVLNQETSLIDEIPNKSVVSLVGDFDPISISTLIRLIDKNCIVVPLTIDTQAMHEYYFENSASEFVINEQKITKIESKKHHFTEKLKEENKPGIVLFSTGTTGRPKAKKLQINQIWCVESMKFGTIWKVCVHVFVLRFPDDHVHVVLHVFVQ